jgi:type II secretion system protein D
MQVLILYCTVLILLMPTAVMAQVQTQARTSLQAHIQEAQAQTQAQAQSQAQASNAAEEKAPAQTLRLVGMPAEKMEITLYDVLGERLKPMEKISRKQTGWVFTHPQGPQVELFFDHQKNEVVLQGSDVLIDQLTRLILALERSATPAGRSICVIPLHLADPSQVLQVIDAYRSGQRDGESPLSNSSMLLQPEKPGQMGKPRANATSQNDGDRSGVHSATSLAKIPVLTGAARPVVYRGQSPDISPASPAKASPAGTPAGAPADSAAPKADESGVKPSVRSKLRSLDSDLEVETLPDLDAIILRGRPREVEELRKIIDEIERLSTETQPEIEIIFLKQAGCEPLGTIIKQVDKEFTGGRQGRVTAVPLVKPNAILLIGWGEALKSVKDLVQKLDIPVSPETRFRVFALRNASATDAQTTIHSFYSSHTGLAPQVTVTADVRTNSLIVQGAPRDLDEIEQIITRLDQPQGEAVRRAKVIKLKNALAADVATTMQAAIGGSKTGAGAATHKNAALELLTVDSKGQQLIRAGLLNDVQITADPRANSLIVAGPPESMELLEAIVKQLDTPSAVAQIKVFRIINGDAPSLITMLRTLLPSAGTGLSGAVAAAGEGESALVPVRFSVDLRSNSIIATGSQGDLAIIEALLLRLDEDKGTQRKNAVYQLKNAPAENAARAINEFLRSERQVQRSAAGAVNPFQQIESEVIVVPEKVSNSLIISATPRFYDDIMEVVIKLDAEPPQVMIQVVIAQVALTNFDEFGIELGLQDSVLFDRSTLSNLVTTTTTTTNGTTTQNVISSTGTPGYAFNGAKLGNSSAASNTSSVGGQSTSNFGVGTTNNDVGYGGLVLQASSESVSVLIRALQQSTRLDVLSRPQIMTLDNQPSFIQVGQRVPRIANASITQVGQQNQIVLENVGLILGVTPRISPDGRVIMEVDAEKSELGLTDDGIPVTTSGGVVIKSPIIDLTTAQTTVSALDGETIVIGGLITTKKQLVKRRVPYLSNIPLLGVLFRYDSHTKNRTEMLIILSPHIVKNPAEAEKLRKMEEGRMHWCLGDVNEVNGPVGFSSKQGVQPTPVVYPDSNPRGKLPPIPDPDIKEPQVLDETSSEPIPVGKASTKASS